MLPWITKEYIFLKLSFISFYVVILNAYYWNIKLIYTHLFPILDFHPIKSPNGLKRLSSHSNVNSGKLKLDFKSIIFKDVYTYKIISWSFKLLNQKSLPSIQQINFRNVYHHRIYYFLPLELSCPIIIILLCLFFVKNLCAVYA